MSSAEREEGKEGGRQGAQGNGAAVGKGHDAGFGAADQCKVTRLPGRSGKKKLTRGQGGLKRHPSPQEQQEERAPRQRPRRPPRSLPVHLKLRFVPESDAWASASSEKSAELGSCVGPWNVRVFSAVSLSPWTAALALLSLYLPASWGCKVNSRKCPKGKRVFTG